MVVVNQIGAFLLVPGGEFTIELCAAAEGLLSSRTFLILHDIRVSLKSGIFVLKMGSENNCSEKEKYSKPWNFLLESYINPIGFLYST